MSTYYRPTKKIPLSKIKKMKEFEVIYDKEQDKEIFFDGKNYIHFATDKNDDVIDLFRYGRNNPNNILNALKSNFSVSMVSEYEDEYYDYEDEETPVISISVK